MTRSQLLIFTLSIIALASTTVPCQSRKKLPVCTQAAFAAFKPIPKLEYDVPEDLTDATDDRLMKLPARVAAIRRLERALATFSSPAWWSANAEELNACEIHGAAGKFTDEETQKFNDGDYELHISGDHQIRLAVIADPHFATEYSGSNAFLLVRKDGQVFVTEVIDGYASRVTNSVGVDFANFNGQTIIEISTANSVPPTLWNRYFAIDPKTNKAVPKNIFKERGKFTNEISSDMLMGEPKEFDLPKDATELNIIRHGRLASSFSAYEQQENGKVDGRLRRIIYRWNGKFYSRADRR